MEHAGDRLMQKDSRTSHFEPIIAVLILLAITIYPAGVARAQSTGQLNASQSSAQPGPGELHLLVGHSLVITSPTRLKRVSIAIPDIADAVVVTPNQVLINGEKVGSVSLVLWDENNQSQSFDVYVDMDITGIAQKVREAFPDEPVQIEATKDLVTISGKVSSPEVADEILKLVQSVAPKAISLMQVPPPKPAPEVLLEVKFAEVDRTALSEFGINLLAPGTRSSGPASTIGTSGTEQFSPPHLSSLQVQAAPNSSTVTANFTLSDLLNFFVFRPDLDLGALVQALKQNNVLQILASPNLLTQSGKEASFLAGGEFPFPVVQGGAGAYTAVTIQFRQFGVQLSFKPTISADGTIHLQVTPEVSSLDFSNALTISGFLVPALSTRRVQTEMDLANGQSFAIAGLVDDRLTNIAEKVPWLSSVPILGQIFKSHSLDKTRTELLVLVTPHIVKPYEPGHAPAGPTMPLPFLNPLPPVGGANGAPNSGQ
jgi:pilus assembly protein CpaC